MMVHNQSDRKRNRIVFPGAAPGVLGAVRTMWMAAVCVFAGCFPVTVQAAPATLTSPDAAVYEQTDEGSSQLGNLVEGSTFEYIGDVTAEDGSVWHQITTSSGVNGYIRGDKEIEMTAEESAGEEQEGQEASPEENAGAPAENVPVDGGEEAGAGEESEETGGEEELPEEDTGEALEENNEAAAINMQNNREKSYVLNPSGRIKERENAAEPDSGIQNGSRIKARIDMPLILGILVVVFCTGAIHICLTRMRKAKCEADGKGAPDTGRNRAQKKIKKKKHAQKRKTKKAVQGRKEGIKMPGEKK